MSRDLDLTNPSTLRAVARRVGLEAKGRYSQNFLVDRSVLDAMTDALGADAESTVFEIGPGIGTLTGALAAVAGRVVAVDLDPACVEATRITQRHSSKVTVVQGDAATIDLDSLDLGVGWLAAGNLPYHMTGVLLSRLFELDTPPPRGVFLIQREVAARLAAASGDWSLATVAIRTIADVERIRDVAPESFDPAPAVHSGVIRMTPNRQIDEVERRAVIELAKAAFQMRRKTLRHGITHALGGDGAAALAALGSADIDSGRRPGTLDVHEWRTLARAVHQTKPRV